MSRLSWGLQSLWRYAFMDGVIRPVRRPCHVEPFCDEAQRGQVAEITRVRWLDLRILEGSQQRASVPLVMVLTALEIGVVLELRDDVLHTAHDCVVLLAQCLVLRLLRQVGGCSG